MSAPPGLDLRHKRLPDSSFVDVDLSGARLDNVSLRGATLNDVSLAGARFRDVSFENADIADCNLQGLRIDGVPVSELLQAHAALQARTPAQTGAAAGPAPTSLVVYARDKARLAAFYAAVLSLRVVQDEPGFCLLTRAGIELSVVRIPPHIASTFTITEPPERREDSALKPAFLVPDLQATRVAVERAGGSMLPASAQWSFGGLLMLDGADPEGNVLQFRQVEG